jgi:hypothetical protein
LEDEPRIHLVIPSAWSKIDVMLLSNRQPLSSLTTYANWSDCYNNSWVLDTPMINITSIEGLERLSVPDIIHIIPTSTDWAIVIWNLLLTIAIILLTLKIYGVHHNVAQYIPFALPQVHAFDDAIQHQIIVLSVTLAAVLTTLIIGISLLCYGYCRGYISCPKFKRTDELDTGLLNNQPTLKRVRPNNDIALTMSRGESRPVELSEGTNNVRITVCDDESQPSSPYSKTTVNPTVSYKK